MDKKDMTFAEIQTNQERFLHQYEVSELFPNCGVEWKTLMQIGDDYETKCYGSGREKQEYKGEYFEIIQGHIAKIASFENVHSYRFRIKKTGSLLAKIIRKGAERGEKYTKENYFNKITDILGIRILYVFKEDVWPVHEQIMAEYENQLAQDISVKLKEHGYDQLHTLLVMVALHVLKRVLQEQQVIRRVVVPGEQYDVLDGLEHQLVIGHIQSMKLAGGADTLQHDAAIPDAGREIGDGDLLHHRMQGDVVAGRRLDKAHFNHVVDVVQIIYPQPFSEQPRRDARQRNKCEIAHDLALGLGQLEHRKQRVDVVVVSRPLALAVLRYADLVRGVEGCLLFDQLLQHGFWLHHARFQKSRRQFNGERMTVERFDDFFNNGAIFLCP